MWNDLTTVAHCTVHKLERRLTTLWKPRGAPKTGCGTWPRTTASTLGIFSSLHKGHLCSSVPRGGLLAWLSDFLLGSFCPHSMATLAQLCL